MHRQIDYENAIQSILVFVTTRTFFLGELPGLPPRWEIEFSFDLVLGTQPISKATYHMGCVDLWELNC